MRSLKTTISGSDEISTRDQSVLLRISFCSAQPQLPQVRPHGPADMEEGRHREPVGRDSRAQKNLVKILAWPPSPGTDPINKLQLRIRLYAGIDESEKQKLVT